MPRLELFLVQSFSRAFSRSLLDFLLGEKEREERNPPAHTEISIAIPFPSYGDRGAISRAPAIPHTMAWRAPGRGISLSLRARAAECVQARASAATSTTVAPGTEGLSFRDSTTPDISTASALRQRYANGCFPLTHAGVAIAAVPDSQKGRAYPARAAGRSISHGH